MSELDEGQSEVLAFMSEREARPRHVRHVAFLALQLFDQLAALHGLSLRERFLLETAALLHDIGHRPPGADAPPTEGHHKESARLIREHDWRCLEPQEIEVVAQVARYHRKTMPEMAHEEFRVLPSWDRRVVQHLAALLRLADALDRSHLQAVHRIAVDVKPNELVFHLEGRGPAMREIQSAQLKGDLAQAVYQRDLVFEVKEEATPANWTGGPPPDPDPEP